MYDFAKMSDLPAHEWCQEHQRYLHNTAREGGSLKALKSYEQKHATDFAYRMEDMEDCMGCAVDREGKQRQLVQAFLLQCVEYEKNCYVRPTLFLGERAFLQWYIREMAMTEKDA